MNSNRLISIGSVALIFASALFSQISFAQNASADAPALVKSDKRTKFKKVMIAPDLSLKKYKNIAPKMGGIEYKYAREGYSLDQREFLVVERDRKGLKQTFGNIFVKELMTSKRFPLVAQPGEESLILRISLIDLVCYLPVQGYRRGNSFTRIMGCKLRAELIDGKTGQVLMEIEDRQSIKSSDDVEDDEWMPQLEEVQKRFSIWAVALRKEIEGRAK